MDENFESMIESAFSGPHGEQLVMLKILHDSYGLLMVESEERGEDFFTFLRKWTAENVLPVGLEGTVLSEWIDVNEADVTDEDQDGYRFLIDLSRVPEGLRQISITRNRGLVLKGLRNKRPMNSLMRSVQGGRLWRLKRRKSPGPGG